MQNINNYLEILCFTYLTIVTKSNFKNRLKRTNRRLESKGTITWLVETTFPYEMKSSQKKTQIF